MPTMDYMETETPNRPPPAKVATSLAKAPLLSKLASFIGLRKTYGQELHDIPPVTSVTSLTSVPLEASDANIPSTETPSLMHSESLNFQEGAHQCQGGSTQEVSNETELNPGKTKPFTKHFTIFNTLCVYMCLLS